MTSTKLRGRNIRHCLVGWRLIVCRTKTPLQVCTSPFIPICYRWNSYACNEVLGDAQQGGTTRWVPCKESRWKVGIRLQKLGLVQGAWYACTFGMENQCGTTACTVEKCSLVCKLYSVRYSRNLKSTYQVKDKLENLLEKSLSVRTCLLVDPAVVVQIDIFRVE